MIALHEVKQQMLVDPMHWALFLMGFVDDFRHYRGPRAIAEPLPYTDPRLDPLLASTAESLCDELGAESPLRFRIRKIFVLKNFLSRA